MFTLQKGPGGPKLYLPENGQAVKRNLEAKALGNVHLRLWNTKRVLKEY